MLCKMTTLSPHFFDNRQRGRAGLVGTWPTEVWKDCQSDDSAPVLLTPLNPKNIWSNNGIQLQNTGCPEQLRAFLSLKWSGMQLENSEMEKRNKSSLSMKHYRISAYEQNRLKFLSNISQNLCSTSNKEVHTWVSALSQWVGYKTSCTFMQAANALERFC